MIRPAAPLSALIAVAALAACGGDDGGSGTGEKAAAPSLHTPTAFTKPTQIDNPYAPVAKGSKCVLEGVEAGTKIRVESEVLGRTEPFTFEGAKVGTAVIEDKTFEDGELVERTQDYVAQDDDGTVFYFGSDVEELEGKKVVGHEGQWRYGKETQTLGVVMPAEPAVGDKWRFEAVPGVTVSDQEVVEQLPSLSVGGKDYSDVIRVQETQVEPEPGTEVKFLARGTGIVREQPPGGTLELVSCS